MVRPENLIPGGSPVRTSPGTAPFRLAGVSDSGLRNLPLLFYKNSALRRQFALVFLVFH